MFSTNKSILILGIGLTALFSACKKDDTVPVSGTFYGQPVQLGNGTARSYVSLDTNGQPQSMGISLSKEALTGLPEGDGHSEPGHVHTFAYELPLPKEASKTPFKHIVLDWNPNGHEPEGVYTKAHFDAHFYMISSQERLQITVNDPKIDILPPADQIPAGYIAIPGGVPQMGKHWIDPTSDEFTEKGFTSTFLYGSYNGAITFFEPMITREFLQSKTVATFTLKKPASYGKEGYYPASYAVRYDQASGAYLIILDNLNLEGK
jgi:hypothetical protein